MRIVFFYFLLVLCCAYSLSLLLPPFYCVPSPSYPSLLYHALTTSIIFSTHLVLYWWNVSIAASMQHFIAWNKLSIVKLVPCIPAYTWLIVVCSRFIYNKMLYVEIVQLKVDISQLFIVYLLLVLLAC